MRLHDIKRGLAIYNGDLQDPDRISLRYVPRNPTEAVAAAEEAVMLLKEEGLVGMSLASSYRQCSKFSLELGMVAKAKAYALKELEVERYCMGTETSFVSDPGNAESWMKHVEWTAERDQVKIRMCEKRNMKEQKKADKKAAKKAGKGGR